MRRWRCAVLFIVFLFGFASVIQGADRGPINSGETKTGISLSGPSYLDSWTFDGNAGDRVIINVVRTDGDADTYIDLYSPPPTIQLEASTAPWYDQLDHQLQNSGTYTILVQDYGLNDSGLYNISFLKIPGSVNSAEDLDGGAIASGETKSGTIDDASDLDAFQFYCEGGDRIIVNVVRTDGDLDTYIDLYSPSPNSAEEASTAPWYDQLDHVCEQSGLYTIIIQDYGLNDWGTYNISLLKIPGAVNSPRDPDGEAIASGETRSGKIDDASDLDAFYFSCEAGDHVIINAVRTDGDLDTYIDLYSPTPNSEKEASTAPWYDQLDHTCEQSGLYTIVIQDYGLNDSGTYNVSLTKIPSTVRPWIYDPSPANGSYALCDSGSFDWSSIGEITGYDVYFGENVVSPLEKIADNLISPPLAFPAGLEVCTTYYWHVVGLRAGDDVQGPYWWFRCPMETILHDVPLGFWAEKYVDAIYCDGITSGYEDGTYRPSQYVTRGQMAAFIIRAKFGEDFDYSPTPHFTDVQSTHGLFKYIQKMYEEGISPGYPDGTYRPSQNVNRAQMATFIAKAFLGMK
jgi:hypothetical protein